MERKDRLEGGSLDQAQSWQLQGDRDLRDWVLHYDKIYST